MTMTIKSSTQKKVTTISERMIRERRAEILRNWTSHFLGFLKDFCVSEERRSDDTFIRKYHITNEKLSFYVRSSHSRAALNPRTPSQSLAILSNQRCSLSNVCTCSPCEIVTHFWYFDPMTQRMNRLLRYLIRSREEHDRSIFLDEILMITEAHKHKKFFRCWKSWKTAAVSEETCTDGVEIIFFYFSILFFLFFLTGKFPYRNVVISFHIFFFPSSNIINSRAACESWADSTTLINTYLLETAALCTRKPVLWLWISNISTSLDVQHSNVWIILWYMCWTFVGKHRRVFTAAEMRGSSWLTTD